MITIDTPQICFSAHKTMAPNWGWQWDCNAFTAISHIQPWFQAVVSELKQIRELSN